MKSPILGILILTSVIAVGCSSNFQENQITIEKTAFSINDDFVNIHKAEDAMVKRIESVYANTGNLELSINNMDVRDGGVFETFGNNQYYYKRAKDGASYYCSIGRPVNNSIKREIRIMQYLESSLLQAQKTNPDLITIAFFGIHKPVSIGMLYPWFDVISMFPPGLKLNVFEWYNRGLKSDGRAIWAKQPFISLASGWVIDIAAPVKVKDVTKGVAVLTVDLAKINSKYIKNQKCNMMLLSSDMTLLGSNNSARDILNLRAIEDFDYVKQMKENIFAPDRFKLSDSSQSPEIQLIASRIFAGEKTFEQIIKGKSYIFMVSDIPEINFYLVGFVKK